MLYGGVEPPNSAGRISLQDRNGSRVQLNLFDPLIGPNDLLIGPSDPRLGAYIRLSSTEADRFNRALVLPTSLRLHLCLLVNLMMKSCKIVSVHENSLPVLFLQKRANHFKRRLDIPWLIDEMDAAESRWKTIL